MAISRITGRLAAALFIAGTAVAASASTQTDPASQLRQQIAAQGLLVWSRERPIQWSDFRGEPPSTNDGAAQTASSFTYFVGCRDSVVAIAVMATFWPRNSWVRPDISRRGTRSVQVLLHERGHFNISEVFARRFRRAVSETPGLCPHHSDRITALFEGQSRANAALQERYDQETAHGTALAPQAQWEAMIRASLDSLARFGEDK